MNLPQNFADAKMAQNITRKLYPSARNISIVEHSYDNIVALVDASCAVRFPRDANAYLRSLYEKHILEQLKGATTLTVPHVLDEHAEPPYLITSFVPGHHISAAAIRAFSKDHQKAFSKSVARFAYSMHSTFILDKELSLRKELGLDELAGDEPWPVYLKRTVCDAYFPTTAQTKIAKSYYTEWVKMCDVSPTVVVHDDLHTLNMMFNDAHLAGVLDFGDTNVGTPEQDLRQLYRINEEVVLTAIQEYEHLSGHQLNIETLKIWAIMQELAVYSKTLAAKKTSHHSFKRACRNLNSWLNEGEWGKGYDLSTRGPSQ